jgi:2-amino-4-hydroxy-6-hydroxymethyldihydropteridine diphosphokinase
MNVAFLSLGGNLGDRRENLDRALLEIEGRCGRIVKRSSLYETEPWGSTSKQKFLNICVKIKTALSARELLERVLLIEEKLGRNRTTDQNSDRTMDVDLLFYNKIERSVKNLQVPHPRLHERKFVLVPLNEIAADFVHPGLNKKISRLLKDCPDRLKVKKVRPLKACRYICIEGNIGAGKTTLAKALTRRLNAELIAEKFEENNILPLFYSDPRHYAFPLEYSFLIARFDQLTNAFREGSGPWVSDYSLYKSLWFARVNLGKKEFRMFRSHFNSLADGVRKPDLMIFLETSYKNLKQNIRRRGRSYEQDIHTEYLRGLSDSYKEGLKALKIPVLEIKIPRYSGEPERQICDKIEKYIEENFG